MKLCILSIFLAASTFLFGEWRLIHSVQDPGLKVYWDTDEKKFFAYLDRELLEPAYWEWTPDVNNFEYGANRFILAAKALAPEISDFSIMYWELQKQKLRL